MQVGNYYIISIHAPHAGSSNHSGILLASVLNFNPRSPCGERPHYYTFEEAEYVFQSTFPVRGTTSSQMCSAVSSVFQSTFTVRGATAHPLKALRLIQFQSTLPVRGATAGPKLFHHCSNNFNPRSPCGERRRTSKRLRARWVFQSTFPVRGTTVNPASGIFLGKFQSTFPVRGTT